jgi:predicted GIY-YIG superfamily endonuclease
MVFGCKTVTPPSMYYVYVLQNGEEGGLYIVYTSDLERRFREHRQRFPKDVVLYEEAYRRESSARERERKLKHYGSAWRALKTRVSV